MLRSTTLKVSAIFFFFFIYQHLFKIHLDLNECRKRERRKKNVFFFLRLTSNQLLIVESFFGIEKDERKKKEITQYTLITIFIILSQTIVYLSIILL
jgi:hypothetical protein